MCSSYTQEQPMWKLSNESEGKRTYINSTTGSKCSTSKVYTDKESNDWYGFEDLMSLPYTRNFAATKISSLYALGLSKDDLSGHINGLKTLLKSDDSEKFEKCYANILDFESKANNATDPVKQMSSLVCVYFLLNDEPIDSFEGSLQIKKISLLEADFDMHAFFLNRQIEAMQDYSQRLNLISKIVSMPLSDMPEVLP